MRPKHRIPGYCRNANGTSRSWSRVARPCGDGGEDAQDSLSAGDFQNLRTNRLGSKFSLLAVENLRRHGPRRSRMLQHQVVSLVLGLVEEWAGLCEGRWVTRIGGRAEKDRAATNGSWKRRFREDLTQERGIGPWFYLESGLDGRNRTLAATRQRENGRCVVPQGSWGSRLRGIGEGVAVRADLFIVIGL